MIDDHRFGQARYTVDEIDAMRKSIRSILWDGYGGKELAPVTEDRLRTYMLNGTTPAELDAEAHEAIWKRRTARLKQVRAPRIISSEEADALPKKVEPRPLTWWQRCKQTIG